VIAILLIDTAADFIDTAAVVWPEEKATAFLRVGLLSMDIDL
jgi:hypothetical protein